MSERVVDYSGLTARADPAAVAAWRQQARASGAPWAFVSPQTIVGYVALGCSGVVFLVVFFGIGGSFVALGSQTSNLAFTVLPAVVLIGGVVAVILAVSRRFPRRNLWTRRYLIARFAQGNGMTYSPSQGNPSYPGEIFQLGRDRTALDHVTTTTGRFLDLGNFRWITGSGKEQTTHTWGFMALSLDRNMPNMVLDSKANNTLFGSNLPATLDKRQILRLEGDFDRFFTLYCPVQYETDALYVFTPDLMALLIDEAAPFDVELVDDWMFVYSSQPFDMTDPAVYARLFRIADTVGTKTLSQTEHYADARIGDVDANVVAPQGARLKRGVSVGAIVVVVVFLAIWSWGFFSPFITALTGR